MGITGRDATLTPETDPVKRPAKQGSVQTGNQYPKDAIEVSSRWVAATGAPEPSTLLILGTGLLGVAEPGD